MKRFLILVLMLLVSLSLTACEGFGIPTGKTIESISINYIGEDEIIIIDDFDLNNYEIVILYTDATTETKKLTEDMISSSDLEKLELEGTHQIDVFYEGVKVTLEVQLIATVEVSTPLTVRLMSIFDKGVEAGVFDEDYTYEEWVESVQGPQGEAGKEVLFQVFDGFIQWQYSGDTEWVNLIDLLTLTGANGTNGVDGDSVLFQVADGFIQWQYLSDTEWMNLIDLTTLTGASGADGVNGTDGLNGADGKEVLFQVFDGFIQWQYSGDTEWMNLIDLTSLTGVAGVDGANGLDGNDGINGIDGTDGINGLSAYEIYLGQYPDYTGDETQWLSDLISGSLNGVSKHTVTFNTNSDTVIEPLTVVHGEIIYAIPTNPEKDGYKFLGWTYGEEAWSFIGYGVHIDITLTAQWELLEFNVAFVDDMFNNSFFETTNITLNNTLLIPSYVYGYNFLGWFDENDVKYEDGVWVINDDLTLYAKWEIDPNVATINVLSELPDEQINISFWHVYGQEKEVLLNQYISEFMQLYPNINIDAMSKGGYADLNNATVNAFNQGTTPTIVLGYNEFLMNYQSADGIIPLDNFANDVNWGIDLDDFISSYIDENAQYDDGFMYSMPFSKSTEIMVYNKTIFEANGITIPTDRPLTWAELETYSSTMVGNGENQCDYLINYDSPANLFTTATNMWGGQYANAFGEVLVNDTNTVAMLNYLDNAFSNKTFATPIVWNQSYGSANFVNGDACMTVGSTAGIGYNIPYDYSFEVGVAPIPQYDLENKSVIQQGPNVAIMSDSTDAERLAAWLFIKYITATEQTAEWSMLTGYLPVRYSAYESEPYQQFLNITDMNDNMYYTSLASKSAILQLEYNDFTTQYVRPISSSDLRNEMTLVIESLITDTLSVETLVANMMDNLGYDDGYVYENPNGNDDYNLLIPVFGLVEGNLNLPLEMGGSPITWTSSNTDVISNNGNVTRPVYSDGKMMVTLTATFTIDAITYTKHFDVYVKEDDPVNSFETVASIHSSLVLGESLQFEGVVTALYRGGYFLTDGIDSISVYNPASTLDIAVGDTVSIRGEYSIYNTTFQIGGTIKAEEITATGGTNQLTASVLTVAEILTLDSADPLLAGRFITVTGTVELRGSYNNVYLVVGDDAVMVAYNSLTTSIDVLEGLVGQEITITTFYYTDHGTNGPMLGFDGALEDIIVNESGVAAALAAIDGDTILVTGIVSGFNYKGEAFIQDTDGTAIFLDTTLNDQVSIGDLVVVQGVLGTNTSYGNDQRELNDVVVMETTSTDNAVFIKTDVDAATLGVITTIGMYSSQLFTMDLTVATLDDGFGYTLFTGDGTTFIKMFTGSHAYFQDMYVVGDTLTMTFIAYDINYDNVRIDHVTLPALNDAQMLTVVQGMLDIPTSTMDDLTLPTAFEAYGATIAWASSDAAVIDPVTGAVVQPLVGAADASVTLTATVTVGSETPVDVVFTVTVPALLPPPSQTLFFSEYAEADGGSCKYVEVYNASDAEVDLSAYSIIKGGNGTLFSASSDEVQLSGMLAAGGVLVIGNSACVNASDQAQDAIVSSPLFPTTGITWEVSTVVGYVNGDDALGLFFNGILVDVIGTNGTDPGSNWAVGNGNLTDGTTANVIMVRVSTVTSGETDWAVGAMQWVVSADDRDYSTVGVHTSDQPSAS